jgi:SAM-dependent methyltransferase
MNIVSTVTRPTRWALKLVHVLNRPLPDPLSYHATELQIALDPRHVARVLPPIRPCYNRILDVGCGMGQTLIALNLPQHVRAFGLDCDLRAIEAGKHIISSNISLVCAQAENLPFRDGYVDFVFSRLALPYTDVQQALGEIRRILKPGGEMWVALHSFSKFRRRFLHAISHADTQQIAVCGYILLNSLLFMCVGMQLPMMRRNETYQTVFGMKAALRRAGLHCTGIETGRFFIVRAAKPLPADIRSEHTS